MGTVACPQAFSSPAQIPRGCAASGLTRGMAPTNGFTRTGSWPVGWLAFVWVHGSCYVSSCHRGSVLRSLQVLKLKLESTENTKHRKTKKELNKDNPGTLKSTGLSNLRTRGAFEGKEATIQE